MAGTIKRVTTNSEIKSGPGIVYAVVLTAEGASHITLKDGGSSGTVMLALRTAAAETVAVSAPTGMAFGSGVYVTVEAGTAEVSVVYA